MTALLLQLSLSVVPTAAAAAFAPTTALSSRSCRYSSYGCPVSLMPQSSSSSLMERATVSSSPSSSSTSFFALSSREQKEQMDDETISSSSSSMNRSQGQRKRDILSQWSRAVLHQPFPPRRGRRFVSSSRLQASKIDEEALDGEGEGEKETNGDVYNGNKKKIVVVDPIKDKLVETKEKVDAFFGAIQTKLEQFLSDNNIKMPQPLQDFVSFVLQKLNDWKLLFLGFGVGAVFACTAILVPIYTSIESLSQPVTLFETILGDLEQAYVDPVDTNRLFETGMNAMLRSLDPYTEFETKQAAADLTESIDGRYAGVGLVIAGTSTTQQQQLQPQQTQEQRPQSPQLLPNAAKEDNAQLLKDGDVSSSNPNSQSSSSSSSSSSLDGTFVSSPATSVDVVDDDDDDEFVQVRREQLQDYERAKRQGIRVVSAFEGYAFDYGMRVGDKIVAIDDRPFGPDMTVDQVRNQLRGAPGTLVKISFHRDGVEGIQSIVMPRTIVRMRDVKLATLLGNPSDGIGYIQLSGFASEAGSEMRSAISYLQQAAEDASDGERSLQGLILDLRGNPGGLLTSAVDVASLLVPKGSDIVSAKGRGFPGILYRSRANPLLDSSTRLAVLVNGGTASAAEIVSGAVQDLDVGIIVGADRTFGKGLVQNVEDLPFNTALKFTVAKYYTPSGRCIQGINYKEGGGQGAEGDGRYVASKVADQDRSVYYTRSGRLVRDGGGIEADYKVKAPKASALEITLLRSGAFSDFAAEWSKKNELTNNFNGVDEDTYKSFQAFVNHKQKSGELNLEELYKRPLNDLRRALKQSGYKGSEKSVDQLQASIVREIQRDFERYSSDIKEDISQNILARYIPESMLIERGVKTDTQVQEAVKLLTTNSGKSKFDKILARDTSSSSMSGGSEESDPNKRTTLATSSSSNNDDAEMNRIRANVVSW